RLRPRERALDRPLRPLRARDLDARVLRGGAATASGVLPRPCPDRGHAVRRRPRARGRRPAARPLARGQRARAEAPRRRETRRLTAASVFVPGDGEKRRAMGLLNRALVNVREGRMQKLLSATTAFSVPPLAFEIYYEHYKGSFGDKWMWTPLLLTPPLTAAGIAGVFSEKAARTWLP